MAAMKMESGSQSSSESHMNMTNGTPSNAASQKVSVITGSSSVQPDLTALSGANIITTQSPKATSKITHSSTSTTVAPSTNFNTAGAAMVNASGSTANNNTARRLPPNTIGTMNMNSMGGFPSVPGLNFPMMNLPYFPNMNMNLLQAVLMNPNAQQQLNLNPNASQAMMQLSQQIASMQPHQQNKLLVTQQQQQKQHQTAQTNINNTPSALNSSVKNTSEVKEKNEFSATTDAPSRNTRSSAKKGSSKKQAGTAASSTKAGSRTNAEQPQQPNSSTPTGENTTSNKKPEPSHVQLEKQIGPLLDEKKGIAKVEDVSAFIKIMTSQENVKSKTILLNALDSTAKIACLRKFVELNGLNVLNKWLSEAATKPNLLKLLSKVLIRLPMTMDGLKSSGIGKIVRKFSKSSDIQDSETKERFAECVSNWSSLLKNKQNDRNDLQGIEVVKIASSKSDSGSNESGGGSGGLFSLSIPKKKKGSGVSDSSNRTVQAVELKGTISRKVISTSGYSSKPLSADDIRKQKMKERLAQGEAKSGTKRKIETGSDANTEKNSKKQKVETSSTSGSPPTRKKRVSWATPDKLEQVKIFEKEPPLPESEIEKKSVPSFSNSSVKEAEMLLKERERRKKLSDMRASIEWQIPLYNESNLSREVNTKEAIKQRAYVREVPSQNSQRPSSPTYEPEYPESQVPIIPLDPPSLIGNYPSTGVQHGLSGTVAFPTPPTSQVTTGISHPPNVQSGGQEAAATPSPGGDADVLQQLAQNPNLLTHLLDLINSDPQSSSTPSLSSSNEHQSGNNNNASNHPFNFQQIPHIPDPHNNSGNNFVPPPHHLQQHYHPPHPSPIQQQPQQQQQNTSSKKNRKKNKSGNNSGNNSNNNNGASIANTSSSSSNINSTIIGSLGNVPVNKTIRCRFYGTKVGCRNGLECKYYHEGVDPIPASGVQEFIPGYAQQVYGGK